MVYSPSQQGGSSVAGNACVAMQLHARFTGGLVNHGRCGNSTEVFACHLRVANELKEDFVRRSHVGGGVALVDDVHTATGFGGQNIYSRVFLWRRESQSGLAFQSEMVCRVVPAAVGRRKTLKRAMHGAAPR